MKIEPVAGPVLQAPGESPNQQSAKARAVEAFMKGSAPKATAQTTPVSNPSQVSPEELSAIAPQVQTPETDHESTLEAEGASETPPKAEPEVTKAPSEEPQLSAQYAQLARQTKAFRAQQVAFKAEQAALQAREEQIKAKEAEMTDRFVPKERIAKDSYNVLLEQGLTPDQITQMLLNAPDPVERQREMKMEALEAEIKALKDGQESTKKTFEEQQRNQYTQAVSLIRTEATDLIASDPNFETIKAMDSVEDVVELITETFKRDGKMLTVEQAASAVEDYLVEEALKIAKLKKIQQRLQPAAPAKAAAAPQATPVQKQPPKTLTSTMNNTRPLTAKERAILAFKGELKD